MLHQQRLPVTYLPQQNVPLINEGRREGEVRHSNTLTDEKVKVARCIWSMYLIELVYYLPFYLLSWF